MITSLARLSAATALAAAFLSAGPPRASAHATLVRCNIARNATLHTAPKTIVCTFAEGVNPRGSFIGVFEATGDGAEDDKGNSAVSFTNAKQLSVGLPSLARGTYLLMWYTISADDGHKAGGSFTFTIK